MLRCLVLMHVTEEWRGIEVDHGGTIVMGLCKAEKYDVTRGRKFVEPHRPGLRSSDRIPAVSPERNAELCRRYDYPNAQFFKVPIFMLFDVSRAIWFGCRWPGKGHGQAALQGC